MLKTKPDFRTGDIVEWNNPVHGIGTWRVVQLWAQGEPYSLLLAPVDKGEATTYVALCVDVTLTQRGPESALHFTRKPLKRRENEGEAEEPCPHPVPVENHC